MIQIASASALLLASVLGWAGVSKLRDLGGTSRSFAALGVRVPVVVVVAVELLTAMSLVLRPRIGGIAAAALLSAFTVVLVRGMRMGAPVSCGCFGSASKEPVGPMTIVRNAFLLVLAASTLAAVRPAHSLAAVLTVGAAAMVGLVVLTLVGLRSTVGPLLAGPIVVPSSLSASVGVA